MSYTVSFIKLVSYRSTFKWNKRRQLALDFGGGSSAKSKNVICPIFHIYQRIKLIFEFSSSFTIRGFHEWAWVTYLVKWLSICKIATTYHFCIFISHTLGHTFPLPPQNKNSTRKMVIVLHTCSSWRIGDDHNLI